MTLSRQQWLGIASLITAVMVGWTAWNDGTPANTETDAVVAAVVRTPATLSAKRDTADPSAPNKARDGNGGAGIAVELDRDPLVEATADPFRQASAIAAPVVKVITAAPQVAPPPAPPQMPYHYFGRMVGVDGQQTTYLARDNDLIPIHKKDVLNATYRIDAITATEIIMTYLPTDTKANIAANSAAN